jgi:hypothetical protein
MGMKVWKNGTEIVVASSAESARALVAELHGVSHEDVDAFWEVPEGSDIAITFECGTDVPAPMLRWLTGKVKAPASEWAKCEPGVIGSTEW